MRSFRLGHLSFAVATLCAAMSPSLRAQANPGALPTGWTVTGGNAAISRNGNTLNIVQATPQALVNFQTFNVGSGAVVNISQPGAQAALLARTTGGGASQIDGRITANGALWLINPAGIMVGAGARIDVGSFVASTLNVSDADFLAGRLTFQGGGSAGAITNAGAITAASGGSIYLVAPSVTNTGTLNAPNGEILLAAGQNVQLRDTGTPGVSIEITGTAGEVRNLGRIVAEAGRIGLAAGLVGNSGEINANSAVSEGGRVFLRASGDLKTAASSDIGASGTTGGRVELIADGAATIDGRVAATGSAGKGGYVDTSGHRSLEVVNVPIVGRGGEWHIDPYNIEIVAGGSNGGTTGTSAIVSVESAAEISAATIVAQLDAGVNVTITTGTGNPAADPSHGDIIVSAAIAKTGGEDTTLTLNANNNIVINAPITSANSRLNVNLNSHREDNYPEANHAVQLNADLGLGGGIVTVSEGYGGVANGTLNIGTGFALTLPQANIRAAVVNGLPAPPPAYSPPAYTPLPAPVPTTSLPTTNICVIAPDSALCKVVSPPTASSPPNAVQQAVNVVIRTVTASAPPAAFDQVALLDARTSTIGVSVASATPTGTSPTAAPADGKTADTATGKTGAKTDDKKDSASVIVKKDEPVVATKKMYCN